MSPRVVFMGSPEFALPILRALAAHYPIAGVVTQPDKPAGRGQSLTPPPVKSLALELGLPVIQPRRLRQPEAMEQLRAWAPELVVVAAFGQILRPEALELPRCGCINVHASLLPRWRGAAPIQAALLAGDAQSGTTIMKMDAGVDTGPLLRQRPLAIAPQDTAETLGRRLAEDGARLLIEVLDGYLRGEIVPQAQDESAAPATYAPMLKKEDGLLNFNETAAALERRVRALAPWPGTYMLWAGQPLKVHRARPAEAPAARPGQRLVMNGLPGVGTPEGALLFEEVQPAGKKPMPGKVFLQGARNWLEN